MFIPIPVAAKVADRSLMFHKWGVIKGLYLQGGVDHTCDTGHMQFEGWKITRVSLHLFTASFWRGGFPLSCLWSNFLVPVLHSLILLGLPGVCPAAAAGAMPAYLAQLHTTPSSYRRFNIGFIYFTLNGDSPWQRIGLTQDYWGGNKVGRRRSCTAPQAHQGCPLIWCRQVWSMPTTFINISSRDLSMLYRKANFIFSFLGGL